MRRKATVRTCGLSGALVMAMQLGPAALGLSRADAEETCVQLWLEREDGSREYKVNECKETGLDRKVHVWDDHHDEDFPLTGYDGFGFDVWLTTGPLP